MKLDVVELRVKNWEEAVKWYQALGLHLIAREDNHKFALLKGEGGSMLGLFGVEDFEKNTSAWVPYFRVKNLAQTVLMLREKSISVGEIEVRHWGTQVKVIDLEGNIFYLYEEQGESL